MRTDRINIAKAIRAKHFTIKQIAEALGQNSNALSRTLAKNPSLEILQRVAGVIGCEVYELVIPRDARKVCPKCGATLKLLNTPTKTAGV